MPITFPCQACTAQITAPDQHAGKRAKCPKCGTSLTIPAAAPQGAFTAPIKAAAAAPAALLSQHRQQAPRANEGVSPRFRPEAVQTRPQPGAASASGQTGQGIPWIRIVPAGLLVLTMIAVLVLDVVIKGRPRVVVASDKDEKEEEKLPPPKIDVQVKDEPEEENQGPTVVPIDPNPWVTLRTTRPNPFRFGLVAKTPMSGKEKKLTFDEQGRTNDTMVRINGQARQLGEGGKWLKAFLPLPVKGDEVRPGHSSQWSCPVAPKGTGQIVFEQILEVVPSRQPVDVAGVPKRVLDSMVVRWVIQNNDDKPNKVGLRIQIDTMIGDNDGVPFTVPGLGLVNTFADFRTPKEVPDFVQALELPDLAKPGTVADFSLRLGGSIEAPDRVSLTRWRDPNNPKAPPVWDVPIQNLGDDSAVVLYWNDQELPAGAKREIGFGFGLGSVTAAAGSKLALALGGSFEPGQVFTVTAYVKNPQKDQSLTLDLPDGLERVEGAVKQMVPLLAGQDTSLVTWKARVQRTGEFPVRVLSSDGAAVKKTLRVSRSESNAGRFTLQLVGTIAPKKDFLVQADVADPAPGQKLTLNLPKEIVLVEGPLEQPAAKVVTWKVRVVAAGSLRLAVVSSTGVTKAKTITLSGSGVFN